MIHAAPASILSSSSSSTNAKHSAYHAGGMSSTGNGRGIDAPLTPPRTQVDLPTPPTSHIELSQATQPPSSSVASSMSVVNGLGDRRRTLAASSSSSNEKLGGESSDVDEHAPQQHSSGSSSPISSAIADAPQKHATEHSPSVVAHQRKAKRVSTGANAETSTASSMPVDGRSGTEQDAQRGRSRERGEVNGNGAASRSRTPSPILGSMVASTGRLSFSVALEPSAEEVRSLLYGEEGEDEDRETARPRSVDKREMEDLLGRLDAMGFAKVGENDVAPTSGSTSTAPPSSRERQLASMVKRLVSHAQKQEQYSDNLEASLHNVRLRSIATLSSLRTSFAHSFAAEYELRARLEAELDGVKTQARKLSQLLARSESRNEELDRERAMSAEEEVMWQEEMKDHASAYAQQQAARARAAQMAQAQGVPVQGPTPARRSAPAGTPKQEPRSTVSGDVGTTIAGADDNDIESPPLPDSVAAPVLDEPFEERKVLAQSDSIASLLPQSASDGDLAGLGISAGATNVQAAQIDESRALPGSPLSTIIKERNKLLADKRYLKSRVRDAESQRDRLELELKSLRPLLVRGVPSKSSVASQLTATPTTPGRSQKRDRSRRRRQAMMGDAEAEHLLLAARRLQTTRKAAAATASVDVEGRPTTPPPLVASSSNPRTPRTPRVAQTPRSTAMMESVTQSTASSSRMADGAGMSTATASPLAGRNGSLGRWGGHHRVDSARSIGGIDDLLQAAQTVLTPGERQRQRDERALATKDGEQEEDQEDDKATDPARRKEAAATLPTSSIDESPKRRRVSSTALDLDRQRSGVSWSPDKSAFAASAAGRRLRTHTEGAEPLLSSQDSHGELPSASQASALSALDLLADQAAASQQPSQSSDRSHSGDGDVYTGGVRSDDSDDGMHIDSEHASRGFGLNGTPNAAGGSHYYPRGTYGHPYAHLSAPGPPPPMSGGPVPGVPHDGYHRMAPGHPPQAFGYGPPSGGSPVTLSSQGWTSQNVPTNGSLNGSIYSPPSAHQHTRFALQSGPRISSGYVANMPDGSRLSKGNAHHHLDNRASFSSIGPADDDDEDDDEDGGGGGGESQHRTPQKGGNTSPDKRLPYVRWSEEEDQKLRRAIGEFGQRWESVARVVGSRTYHQCRQRYLLMRRKEAAAREGHSGGSGDDRQRQTASPVS